MKITLLLIGRTSPAWLHSGCVDYAKRVQRYIGFQILIVPDLRNTRNMPVPVLCEKEAEVLLSQVKSNDILILLDEKGMSQSTLEFSNFLQGQMSSGAKHLVFVVAGAYGASPALKARANYTLSLSRLTFPHQLVRLLFLEQLYRGFSILKNEPYHNE